MLLSSQLIIPSLQWLQEKYVKLYLKSGESEMLLLDDCLNILMQKTMQIEHNQ